MRFDGSLKLQYCRGGYARLDIARKDQSGVVTDRIIEVPIVRSYVDFLSLLIEAPGALQRIR